MIVIFGHSWKVMSLLNNLDRNINIKVIFLFCF